MRASVPLSRIRLDAASRVPVSEQLAAEIERRIERGELGPGERLPPVRGLADRLAVAPNTVAKAYRALEDRGRLVGDGRRGTFVSSASALEAAAAAFARRASALGASERAAVAAVRHALRRERG